MSRVGKLPVAVPEGVSIDIDGSTVTAKGPNGTLSQGFSTEVTVKVADGAVLVERTADSKRARSMHGLYRNLINNMVTGVSTGFAKILVINGVGYRAEVQEKILVLNLGYSNPVDYPIPEDVSISCEGPTRITVAGTDKQRVGQVAAEIRSIRPPEPYKGKGVRYEDEYVRRKVGKAGVK